MATVTLGHEKIRIPNNFHYSDFFSARHTSFIVSKGSALQVKDNNQIIRFFPMHISCFLVGRRSSRIH